VAPERLRAICEEVGIELTMRGLRFSVPDYVRFLRSRGRPVRMVATKSLAGVYQGVGRKRQG
jgi:2-polyprenyl-6-hydroxyphenyl methylase/3-demethylubiquinone-9 3-methyltransferase